MDAQQRVHGSHQVDFILEMPLPDSLRHMDESDARIELLRHFVSQDRKWMHDTPARLLGNAYLQKVLEETNEKDSPAGGVVEGKDLPGADDAARSAGPTV